MFHRIRLLSERFGFQPKVIYDVGAYEGEWTRDCKRVYPNATYYQFEANQDKRDILMQNNQHVFMDVLGKKDEEKVGYFKTLGACGTGNSVYKENTKHYEAQNCVIEDRSTKSLDSLVQTQNLPWPEFLKLDTQGSELDILKGAEKCLNHAEVILMEVSLHEYNQNIPLMADVLSFMKSYGWVIFDIVDYHFVKDILIQVDVLFCKEKSRFMVKQF